MPGVVTLSRLLATDASGHRIDVARLSAARVWRTLYRILRRNPLCAIATADAHGAAYINTAYFAYSRSLDLFFLSHPESHHCRNLQSHPSSSMAVYESPQEWGALDRGVQLFGRCRKARGVAARTAARVYAARFDAYSEWMRELDAAGTAHEYRFYRFAARRVKVFDEREFGSAVFVTARVVRPSRRSTARGSAQGQ